MTPAPRDMPSSVKKALTPRRRRRITENDDYAAFVRRILRAYSRRIAQGDIDALTELAAVADETDQLIRRTITGLRNRGYSWNDIGTRLGVTRQAAQQRWGSDRP